MVPGSGHRLYSLVVRRQDGAAHQDEDPDPIGDEERRYQCPNMMEQVHPQELGAPEMAAVAATLARSGQAQAPKPVDRKAPAKANGLPERC